MAKSDFVIQVINVHRVTKDGFSTMETIVEGLDDYSGRQLRVLAKNENYIAQIMKNGVPHEVLACTPDLITIIDSNSGTWCHLCLTLYYM